MALTQTKVCATLQRMSKPPFKGLVRGIHRWDLVAITINGIIGAGIFGLPAKVFALIGAYSLFAFVACALVVTLIILCFAEVSSRFDQTGGPYLYAREAFGPTVAFEVGWLIWLARLTAFAANCNLLVSYLGYFWPGASSGTWRPIIIAVVVVSLAGVNILGVRQAAIAGNFFTVGKLIPMILFVVAGLFFLNPHAYSLGPVPSSGAFSQSVLLLIYAFTGFEMAAIPAGEVHNPQKHLPRALLIAIAVVALLYILIQVVCVGTLPELAQSQKPLADAGTRFMGAAGGALISAGAIISITGNLNIVLLSGSRVPFAMAEQRQLPALIGKVHSRFFTPHIAILCTAAVMFVLTLKQSFVQALTISAIARLLTYAATCAALPVLRRTNAPAPLFRLRGGTIISVLALLLSGWLLLNSTLKEAITAAIVAGIGLLVYLAYRLLRSNDPDNS
ncbi:MAG: amino acid permease-associated protein [Acidobacteria bacterium]|nr:amino acid permease-associated protein [Acidobacteriota bacterium]